MINKYIAVYEDEYSNFVSCEIVIGFQPFQSAFDKDMIENEVKFLQKKGLYQQPVLDTGLFVCDGNNWLLSIMTIQEWFTKYATGVKETRDDVDLKIKNQYIGQ